MLTSAVRSQRSTMGAGRSGSGKAKIQRSGPTAATAKRPHHGLASVLFAPGSPSSARRIQPPAMPPTIAAVSTPTQSTHHSPITRPWRPRNTAAPTAPAIASRLIVRSASRLENRLPTKIDVYTRRPRAGSHGPISWPIAEPATWAQPPSAPQNVERGP